MKLIKLGFCYEVGNKFPRNILLEYEHVCKVVGDSCQKVLDLRFLFVGVRHQDASTILRWLMLPVKFETDPHNLIIRDPTTELLEATGLL